MFHRNLIDLLLRTLGIHTIFLKIYGQEFFYLHYVFFRCIFHFDLLCINCMLQSSIALALITMRALTVLLEILENLCVQLVNVRIDSVYSIDSVEHDTLLRCSKLHGPCRCICNDKFLRMIKRNELSNNLYLENYAWNKMPKWVIRSLNVIGGIYREKIYERSQLDALTKVVSLTLHLIIACRYFVRCGEFHGII